MKGKQLIGVVTALAFGPAISNALTFNFVSEPEDGSPPSALIQYDGDPTRTMTFVDAGSGFDFVISTSDSPTLVGMKGNIDGVYTVGSITSNGGLESASVTGMGTFSIFDGTDTLTGDISWEDVFTFGTVAGLNMDGATNLSNVVYTGSDPGLIELRDSSNQTVTVSTQFVPAQTLTELMSSGSIQANSYSGTYNAVPEPTPIAMLWIGLLALMRRRRKRVAR